MKTCTNCNKTKEQTEFYKNNKMSSGFLNQCKECVLKNCKERHKNNKEYRLKKMADWRRDNPDYQREYDLIKKYGITLEDYDLMLAGQEGRCKICETEDAGQYGRFHVDHNHETGEIRGLLCHHCNTALGLFKDSPEILSKALQYLKEFGHYGA